MTKATTVNEIKLRQLDEALCACCSVPTAHAAWNKELAIAFSGGLDSRFLAFAARMFGYSVTLLHVHGPHVSPHESGVCPNLGRQTQSALQEALSQSA